MISSLILNKMTTQKTLKDKENDAGHLIHDTKVCRSKDVAQAIKELKEGVWSGITMKLLKEKIDKIFGNFEEDLKEVGK